MIPLKLSVKNFLCYRDNAPTLDLESVHVACLCGDNGHGKSALLDAITFALWGSSRLGDRNHDDLVHKGQREMQVDLEFESGGERYRVVRKRSVGRSQGTTGLEFFIQNSQAEWRAITGNTLRDTQAFISDRIRMDHETFVNTAFLRQGDADRFTTSRPADRKRILAEALDLSYYDELEARARDEVAELRARIQRIEADVELRLREAEGRAESQAAMRRVQDELDSIEPQFAEARSTLDSATRQVYELDAGKTELGDLERRIPQLTELAQNAVRRTADFRARVTESERLISERDEIRRRHAEFEELRREDDRLTRALARKNQLDRSLAEQEQAVAVERDRLETRLAYLDDRLARLNQEAAKIPRMEDTLNKALQMLKEVEDLQSRLDNQDLMEKRIRHDLEQLEGSRAKYEEFHEALRARRNIIQEEKLRLESESRRLNLTLENDLRPQADSLPALLEERRKLAAESKDVDALSQRIDKDRDSAQSLDRRAALLEQENRRLRETMADTRRKFDLLQSGDLECPLCGQALDAGGREHLRSEFESLGMESKTRYQANDEELARIAKERLNLSRSIDSMEADRRAAQRNLQNRQGAVAARIDQAEDARNRADAIVSDLLTLSMKLETGAYAEETRSEVEALEGFLGGIDFDSERLDRARERHREITQAIREQQQKLNDHRLVSQRMEGEARHQLETARELCEELEPTEKELADARRALESGDYALHARVRVEKLSAEIAELGYDPAAHESTRDRLLDLHEFPALMESLRAAAERVEWEREELANAETQARALTAELNGLRERRETLSRETQRLPDARAARDEAQLAFDSLQKRVNDANERMAVIRGDIERSDRMAAEAAELGKRRDETVRERGLYEDLVIAFGRNGIQALIIEDALPQIENDANDLLARLTDNRMSLKLQLIEGRRIRGSDTLSEEMSIDISDEMGTRAYETFSGGEAFRINFALRIALSRLLARRSGAPLPILIIDEGFGSQDASGQERLVEAIQSIQDDFDKIIVITHVESIKEAFDTRIQVVKTEMGSTFDIIWA